MFDDDSLIWLAVWLVAAIVVLACVKQIVYALVLR
jgi:hypothetical protein